GQCLNDCLKVKLLVFLEKDLVKNNAKARFGIGLGTLLYFGDMSNHFGTVLCDQSSTGNKILCQNRLDLVPRFQLIRLEGTGEFRDDRCSGRNNPRGRNGLRSLRDCVCWRTVRRLGYNTCSCLRRRGSCSVGSWLRLRLAGKSGER